MASRVVVALVVFLFAFAPLPLSGQTAPGPPLVKLDSDTVRATVKEVAAIVSREYMDAAVGERVAGSLRRRLDDGAYESVTTSEALAAQLTGDLLTESQDKHLAVTIARQSPSSSQARATGVRETNAGVQRVEILPGNVGYLNLTVFWRLEEARQAITDAMRLLGRADALIIDMRQNSGGSPGTVALLVGYLFDEGGVPLFDIVSRSGDRVTYTTSTPAPPERDGRRPTYVLTSARTFSAGEGLAFLLQERARAEVVGERTAGAANPGRPYPVGSFFEVTVPNAKIVSAVSGGNWEGRGVRPDVEAAEADALSLAHARAQARLRGVEDPISALPPRDAVVVAWTPRACRTRPSAVYSPPSARDGPA